MFSLEQALANYGVYYLFFCEREEKTPRVVVAYTVDTNSEIISYGYSVRYRPTDGYHEPTACDIAAMRMMSEGELIPVAKNEKPAKTILRYLATSANKMARKWYPLRVKWIAQAQFRKAK